MRCEMSLLKRLAAKLVHDILPAAMASVIGGVLFTHLHLSRAPELPVTSTAASAEMMHVLRDEHGLMVNFLNAEMAKEKAQLAAAETLPSPAGAGVESSAAPRPAIVAIAAVRPLPPRNKTPVVVGASLLPPPLVIAQAQQSDNARPVAHGDDSLLAKTIGLKDHVVAATQRVVSAIGGIPSWIGSIGDHIGGQGAAPRPPVDLMSAS